MKYGLSFVGALFAAFAILIFISAKTSIHEIEAFLVALIAVMLLVGAAIVHAVQGKGQRAQTPRTPLLDRGSYPVRVSVALAIAAGVITCAMLVGSRTNEARTGNDDYEAGRAAEIARERAENPGFDAGYAVGERVGHERGRLGVPTLPPVLLRERRDEEFTRSGRTDSAFWKVGFETGYERGFQRGRRDSASR